MSSSFHNADQRTHRKILFVGFLLCAAFVAVTLLFSHVARDEAVSFFAREQPDNGYVLVKADKLIRTAGTPLPKK